jgi:hypothetical protein
MSRAKLRWILDSERDVTNESRNRGDSLDAPAFKTEDSYTGEDTTRSSLCDTASYQLAQRGDPTYLPDLERDYYKALALLSLVLIECTEDEANAYWWVEFLGGADRAAMVLGRSYGAVRKAYSLASARVIGGLAVSDEVSEWAENNLSQPVR